MNAIGRHKAHPAATGNTRIRFECNICCSRVSSTFCICGCVIGGGIAQGLQKRIPGSIRILAYGQRCLAIVRFQRRDPSSPLIAVLPALAAH